MTQSKYPDVAATAAPRLVLRRPWFATCAGLLLLASTQSGHSAPRDEVFDDPMFRRCISWMLDGTRGALIESLCVNDYALPGPSLFLCARKVMTGFSSESDREGCALVFEEQARKVRSGYLK